MKKVLVTDYVHKHLIEGLEHLGYTVTYNQAFNPDDLDDVLPQLSGIIINSKIKMTAERIRISKNLKFIGRLGSGLDIIDLPAARDSNIMVINTPAGNCDAVAEHAVGMLLCLANKLISADHHVRKKSWEREMHRGFELGGKRLGIVGLGHTGQSLARKLSSWALDIQYYDPYVFEVPANLSNIERTDYETLLKTSDFISYHVQLTSETNKMLNEETIAHIKSGAILINTSRGKVCDMHTIVAALESGKLGGACLDVFENEKPAQFTPQEEKLYQRLYKMEQVVLSPHVAGWTHESLYRIADILLKKIAAVEN